ncbi:hypothetical protein TRFO_27621 [Tritrichomonas foetus]|uniref:Uncharacterized protein n=1 Tax=Tritrichomonas foetus TaxID=1144522 RepID=A0A1J4K5T2_9EUKA|nr:hypothetical protein TRFO_27621 [Tritrichomonas foetus]|eukprot:OHT04829.1 hypothetical protein TRFO_27621 [Tritrichomonas foetus]
MNAGAPVYSLSPGFNKGEILIAGGGGVSKSGLPNSLIFAKINDDGSFQTIATRKFEKQVTCVTARLAKKKTYAAVAVGSEIILMNRRYEPITTFDTHMQKFIFRSLDIAPTGHIMVAVDGDDSLRLFSLPSLKEIASTHENSVQRASFMTIDGNLYIACASQNKIQILKPESDLPLVAESEEFQLEPKEVKCVDNVIYFNGADKKKMCSSIIKLAFNGSPNLAELSNVTPGAKMFTAMGVTSNSVLLATRDGDVVILNRFSLKISKIIPKVHTFIGSAITGVDNFVVSGSFDHSVVATEYHEVKQNFKKFIYLCVAVLLLAVFIGISVNHGK